MFILQLKYKIVKYRLFVEKTKLDLSTVLDSNQLYSILGQCTRRYLGQRSTCLIAVQNSVQLCLALSWTVLTHGISDIPRYYMKKFVILHENRKRMCSILESPLHLFSFLTVLLSLTPKQRSALTQPCPGRLRFPDSAESPKIAHFSA